MKIAQRPDWILPTSETRPSDRLPDLAKIDRLDQDLYLSLLEEFPCFTTYPLPARIEQIYDDYMDDHLNDAQDLVFEFLLDLVGSSPARFVFQDGFHHLDPDNRLGMIRALTIYTESTYH